MTHSGRSSRFDGNVLVVCYSWDENPSYKKAAFLLSFFLSFPNVILHCTVDTAQAHRTHDTTRTFQTICLFILRKHTKIHPTRTFPATTIRHQEILLKTDAVSI